MSKTHNFKKYLNSAVLVLLDSSSRVLYTALICRAKNFALQACWKVFVLL